MSKNNQNPESQEIGKMFENYLRCHIFVKKHFIILDKTYSFHINQDEAIEPSVGPDFRMRDKSNKIFYLETKFISAPFNEKINWCTADELKLYQDLDKTHPVFIAIGLGGKADYPKNLFVIPLKELLRTDLSMIDALKYQVVLGRPITPDTLWNLDQMNYRKAV